MSRKNKAKPTKKKYLKIIKNKTKKYKKKNTKKYKKGGNNLDDQQKCQFPYPNCSNLTIPYDQNCNSFYEEDGLMCRNPINHKYTRFRKKNVTCSSNSNKKPKIKYCEYESNTGVKKDIENSIKEIKKNTINLKNFYNESKNIISLRKDINWENFNKLKNYYDMPLTKLKQINEELENLYSYLYDPINPVQSKSWILKNNFTLKKEIISLDKMYRESKFVFDRFAYLLNLYLTVLTINELFEFKIVQIGGVKFDLSNENYILPNFPEELVDFFDKYLYKKSPIVKLKFENSDSNLEKLDDINRRINFSIITFYKYRYELSLIGYYKYLKILSELINENHPENIKERQAKEEFEKKQIKSAKLGITFEDLDDPEKVSLAKTKLRESQAKRYKELTQAESIRRSNKEAESSRRSIASPIEQPNISEEAEIYIPEKKGIFDNFYDRASKWVEERATRKAEEKRIRKEEEEAYNARRQNEQESGTFNFDPY